MRGYSGSIGASTNIGRSEHISAFKCLQSVCLSGSAYGKSGLRPPELRGRCLSAYEFWGIFGVFGVEMVDTPP